MPFLEFMEPKAIIFNRRWRIHFRVAILPQTMILILKLAVLIITIQKLIVDYTIYMIYSLVVMIIS